MGLITTARAKQSINQSSFTAGEDTQIASLIEAVSAHAKKYCRQDFGSTSYDELYSGDGSGVLVLRHYPLLSVSRIASGPVTVLTIQNPDASNQRATVQVTSSGLTLVRVASASATSSSPTFAGNTTLTAMATAINALGGGWSASVVDGHGNRASADLRAIQGALDAVAPHRAEIVLHADEISDCDVDAERGILRRCAFACGIDNYRIVYSAGASSVPEDVQEACAQWVAALFWQTKDNPADYPTLPTAAMLTLLGPHRRHGL